MRVILEVLKGPQKGKRFVFDQHETFMVGRNKRVQFRIPDDKYFSRHHLMIEIAPPRCFLRDLGSTNGTKVNGKKVREAHLNDGDLVHGGRTTMRVRIEKEEPPAASAAMEPASIKVRKPAGEQVTEVLGHTPGELRCFVCKTKPKGNTYLDDLSQTQLVAYVCPACRDAQQSPDNPVPNYEKLGTLGNGILGPVLKARRISTGKLAALKLISPEMASNPDAVKLFLREVQLTVTLDHPHIVPVIEIGQAGKELWIATEWMDGMDAAKLTNRMGGKLPLRDAVNIVTQVLDALEYAHGLNLVHRDVKPSNIIVSGQPGAYEAKLADFGLVRNMDEAGISGITREGEVRGSVYFMPPEQVLDCRFVKEAGDIYAAGATLYWLLTGDHVRDFETVDRRGELVDPYLVILEKPVVPICERDPSVPQGVADVLTAALADDVDDRFETAAEMARELRAAV
jgi:serine/threonine-protein kinase